jgi:hypothetical protein
MKKFVLAGIGATVMILSLSASQAANPAGPTEMANTVPAALCGPGYAPSNISNSGGRVTSYKCTKTIPDQRPCNKFMNKLDSDPVAVGNNLKLGYTCALPVG